MVELISGHAPHDRPLEDLRMAGRTLCGSHPRTHTLLTKVVCTQPVLNTCLHWTSTIGGKTTVVRCAAACAQRYYSSSAALPGSMFCNVFAYSTIPILLAANSSRASRTIYLQLSSFIRYCIIMSLYYYNIRWAIGMLGCTRLTRLHENA